MGSWRHWALSAALLLLALAPGCKGSARSATVTDGHGSVTILITDGPTDRFEHVFIEITRLTLSAGDGSEVVVFEGEERIDLLRFQEGVYLLTTNPDIPSGQYTKLRLEFSGVELEPAPPGLEAKLPGGAIDIDHPGSAPGSFDVSEGIPLFLTIDIDAEKSIEFHGSGGGGEGWTFRPVVLVDVRKGQSGDECFPEIAGTIVSIVEEEDGDDGDGDDLAELVVDLGSDRGSVRLELEPGTALYAADAESGDLSSLRVGDRVLARGELEDDAEIGTAWIMVGDPAVVRCALRGAADGGVFPFQAEGEDAPRWGRLSPGTLIRKELDEDPLETSVISAGREARLIGAWIGEGASAFFRAAVIEILPSRLRGVIAALDRARGKLTLEVEGGGRAEVAFGPATPVLLVGDGALRLEDLRKGQTVNVTVDLGEEGEDRAIRIEVEPRRADGQAWELDRWQRKFMLRPAGPPTGDDQPLAEVEVTVAPTATVLLAVGEDLRQVDLDTLEEGDRVVLFGIIPDVGLFDARTVVIHR